MEIGPNSLLNIKGTLALQTLACVTGAILAASEES